MNDIDLVYQKLGALIERRPEVINRESLVLVYPGTPVAWERPGEVKRGKKTIRFTPKRTRDAEEALMWSFIKAAGRRPRPLFLDTVGIVTMFFVPTMRRKDTDNLAKLVMDAATKANVWDDDSQVIVSGQWLELDRENPRTLIAIAPVRNTRTKAPLLMTEVEP